MTTGLERQLLDAIPSYVFAVDEDVKVLDYNAAAGALLRGTREEVLQRRSGELLQCIHATESPEGCGHSEACDDCVVRNSVTEAFTGQKIIRRRVRMHLRNGGALTEFHGLLTASPFLFEGRKAVLLILEDISEIIELQRIIPICMHCKKVRDDEQFWSNVEAYLHRHLDLRFTHGLCPDCFRSVSEKIKGYLHKAGDREFTD
jgi:hypothetical protein